MIFLSFSSSCLASILKPDLPVFRKKNSFLLSSLASSPKPTNTTNTPTKNKWGTAKIGTGTIWDRYSIWDATGKNRKIEIKKKKTMKKAKPTTKRWTEPPLLFSLASRRLSFICFFFFFFFRFPWRRRTYVFACLLKSGLNLIMCKFFDHMFLHFYDTLPMSKYSNSNFFRKKFFSKKIFFFQDSWFLWWKMGNFW